MQSILLEELDFHQEQAQQGLVLIPCDFCSCLLSALVIRGFEAVPGHRASVNLANHKIILCTRLCKYIWRFAILYKGIHMHAQSIRDTYIKLCSFLLHISDYKIAFKELYFMLYMHIRVCVCVLIQRYIPM